MRIRHWLHGFPSASTGTFLCFGTIRITASRFVVPVCFPHRCFCSKDESAMGYHDISCQLSASRIPRHAVLSNIFRWALTSANARKHARFGRAMRHIENCWQTPRRQDSSTLVTSTLVATNVDTLSPLHLNTSKRVIEDSP